MGIINNLKGVQSALQFFEKSSPTLYGVLGKMGFRVVEQTPGTGARRTISPQAQKNLKSILTRQVRTVASSKSKDETTIRSAKLLGFICPKDPAKNKAIFNRQWDKLLKACDGDSKKAQSALKAQIDETLNKDQLADLITMVKQDGATRGLDRAGLLAMLEALESSRLEYGSRAIKGTELASFIREVKESSIINDSVELKKLGGGAVNTVYSGTFVDHEGNTFQGVFKPAPASLPLSIKIREEIAGTAKQSGIPVGENSYLDQRAFATTKVDQGLFKDKHVNVPTYYAVVNGQRGIVMQMAQGGSLKIDKVKATVVDAKNASPEERRVLTMLNDMTNGGQKINKKHLKFAAFLIGARKVDYKDGKLIRVDANFTAGKKEVNFYNPNLIEQYQRLQVLDIITGQVDRHPENYFINADDNGRPTLEAIDSDCAFGVDSIPPKADVRNQWHPFLPNKGSLILRMPTVLTEEVRDSVINYTEEQLREDLKGHISPEEVDAAIHRLQALKAHIQSDKCSVVKKEQLLEPGYLKQLKPDNSYWARDLFVYKPKEDMTTMGPGGRVVLTGSGSWNYLRESQDL